MKYIRTKNIVIKRNPKEKLFDDTGLHFFVADLSDPNYLQIPEYSYYEKDIVAQADTIEELCDEFRGVWKNYYNDGSDAHEEYHYDSRTNEFFDDFEELTSKEAIEKFDMFYGAIWTDKGLIYVAKMNEKGELELI